MSCLLACYDSWEPVHANHPTLDVTGSSWLRLQQGHSWPDTVPRWRVQRRPRVRPPERHGTFSSCSPFLTCGDLTSGSQGVPPATVAEFTLGFNGQPDNYDGQWQGRPFSTSSNRLLTLSRPPSHLRNSVPRRRLQHPHVDHEQQGLPLCELQRRPQPEVSPGAHGPQGPLRPDRRLPQRVRRRAR